MKAEIIDNVTRMTSMANEWSFSRSVALVPTMGSLHEGHLALVREAAAKADKVVVSIFVNPLQFGPSEDFAVYPRDLERDASMLMEVGADIIFAPDAKDLTPDNMVFSVNPGAMGSRLCGKYRPGHFSGVSTIVTKLFQVVRPGVAVFGWKDAQQFLLLEKMTRDLNIPVELVAVETARESDGLAMSSRNVYLNDAQRSAAPLIFKGLQEVRTSFRKGVDHTSRLIEIFHKTIQAEPLLSIQYAKAVTMDSLESIDKVQADNTLFAVAVYAGETRLIDNLRL